MMEPIIVKVRIEHDARIEKEFLGYTSYDVIGQGDFNGVKGSVESVVRDFLYYCPPGPLPQPQADFFLDGYRLEQRVERHYESLPLLVFEYYRQPQN